MSLYKIYKPLSLVQQEENSGLEILLAEMTEIKTAFKSRTLEGTMFSPFDGKIFIFLYNSALAQQIISNPEHEVKINLDDFRLLATKFIDFPQTVAYFHNSYLDEKEKINNKGGSSIVNIYYALYCKLCGMRSQFNQPILLLGNKVTLDKQFFLNLLSDQTIECRWCINKSKGIDENRFTIYETQGLVENFAPTGKIKKRFEWYESLDSVLRYALEQGLPINTNDFGWGNRWAYCNLVFEKSHEQIEDGFKLVFYNLAKIISETGRIQTLKKPYPCVLQIGINEIPAIEYTIAADNCSFQSSLHVTIDGKKWQLSAIKLKNSEPNP